MRKLADKIVCILCKQAKDSSREHVVQRAIGGSVVSPDTCRECNNSTSDIDQALAEHSVVALSRISDTPGESFAVSMSGPIFLEDPDTGLMLDAKLRNGMQAEILPQVHVSLGDGLDSRANVVAKNLTDQRRLDEYIRSRIDNGTIRGTFVKEGPANAGTTARLVLHRRDDAYVRVPVGRRHEAASLLEMLEKGWQKTGFADLLKSDLQVRPIEMPRVRIGISVMFDRVYRAIAKIALNVVAMEFGADFALRREFDGVREYILGRDIRGPETLANDQVAVDGCFVREHSIEDLYIATDEHLVVLAPSGASGSCG